jgi:hypothetical protein
MTKEESQWVKDYIRDAKEMIRSSKGKSKQEFEQAIKEFIRLKAIEWHLDGVKGDPF